MRISDWSSDVCSSDLKLSGCVVQTWAGNAHTERGHEQEPEARSLYAFMRDVEPVQIGFIRRGPLGCSPDSLVAGDGLLEIKTKLGHLQRSEEHTSELQSLMRISYAVFCLQKKKKQ